MKVSRNYDEYVEQEDFKLIPDGDYMFEIAEIKDGYSGNNDPMPNITLRCIEEEEYEGIYVWDNILIPEPNSPSHKIIGRSKRFLHAIGEPYQGDFDVDTENWLNKTVEVKIGTEEYKGKKKNIVLRYLLSEKQQTKHDKENTYPSKSNTELEEKDLPW